MARRRTLWGATAVIALGMLPGISQLAAAPADARHPMALQAESRFFTAFTAATEPTDTVLRDLMTAFFVDPEDARTNLLLGLNHLWLAAEGDHNNPRVIEHLFLAERFLDRAQRHDPDDARIDSWLLPARSALATIERDEAGAAAFRAAMVNAYESDPNFHSFSVGVQSFDAARSSERFAFGLEAMRNATGCLGSGDPTCGNHPHWPHNVEAFTVFAADFETKAGNVQRARSLLEGVRDTPSFASWPYRSLVDSRLDALSERAALYANDNREDDPVSLFTGDNSAACQACHRSQ